MTSILNGTSKPGTVPPNDKEERVNSNSSSLKSSKSSSTSAAAAPSQANARPPKPVRFGSGLSGVSAEGSQFSDVSGRSSSRDLLRQDLAKRRQSLTPQEHGFLERLIVDGDDVEIELAREKLCDENLFFEKSNKSIGESSAETGGWGDAISINGGVLKPRKNGINESTIETTGSGGLERELVKATVGRKASIGSDASVGSLKRLEHLEARKKNDLHGRMWKAHESGLALTKGASRKSVMRRASAGFGPTRRSSQQAIKVAEIVARASSFLSKSTEDLLKQGGPKEVDDDIFRDSDSDSETDEKMIQATIKRMQNSSLLSSSGSNGRRSISGGSLPPPGQFPKVPLRRQQSEGHRKSVTFREGASTSPENKTKVQKRSSLRNAFPGLPRPTLGSRGDSVNSVNSDSLPGFPPPPRQQSAGSRNFSDLTMESFPPVRRPPPMRKDSLSSIPSLHHGHPVRSDSMSSFPSIHHAHPIRSNSLASLLASPRSPGSHMSTEGLFFHSPDSEDASEPAWSSPLSPKEESEEPRQKPVLLRLASQNADNGVGFEVSEINDRRDGSWMVDTVSTARKYESMVSFGDMTNNSIYSAASFDETKSVDRPSIFRRSNSEDDISGFLLGSNAKSFLDLLDSSSLNELRPEDDDASWDMDSEIDHYDAWNVLKDEYALGYGNEGLSFRILGTSADDVASQPHVLSPPLMESLQSFFPYVVSEDNFWMKYSLVRDGAFMYTLLQNVRGAQYTVLAMETADGEVFGSFTGAPWRKNWNFFGTGESFLWRMRQSRKTPCHSIIDQAHLESELDVYPWTGDNNCVQLCTHDRIAVGGGSKNEEERDDDSKAHHYGFGLAIDSDLLNGTSHRCLTFASPPLSREQPDGFFEIVNLEVWALTPCMTVEEAEKLELSKLFLESN